MKRLIDWNAHFLPETDSRFPRLSDTVTACRTLYGSGSFSKLVLTPTYDSSSESVQLFLLRRHVLIRDLKQTDGWDDRIAIVPSAGVLLNPGLHQVDDLSKLTVVCRSIRYLPIRLPVAPYADWMDLELNRLLYRAKFRLLFLSFDLSRILYPDAIIKKLTRISGAAYQFGFHTVSMPENAAIVRRLVARGADVLLGSAIREPVVGSDVSLQADLDAAMRTFSANEWKSLIKKT